MIVPVSVSQTTGLDFGTFTASASSGTVTINQSTGSTTAAGGATKIVDGARAEFAVAGDPGRAYSISTPSTATLTKSGGGATMTTTLVASKTNGTLGSGGSDNFYVGGALTVGANQTTGVYNGTYTVTVNY